MGRSDAGRRSRARRPFHSRTCGWTRRSSLEVGHQAGRLQHGRKHATMQQQLQVAVYSSLLLEGPLLAAALGSVHVFMSEVNYRGCRECVYEVQSHMPIAAFGCSSQIIEQASAKPCCGRSEV